MTMFGVMMNKCVFIIAFTACLCLVSPVSSSQIEMTIQVDARREECFYEKAEPEDIIDLDYQVIDGGNGQLDINCRFFSPSGLLLHSGSRKTDYNHRFNAEETGDYKLCFDNTFSYINSKTVYFELIIENEGENNMEETDYYTPEELYDMKLQDIEEAMSRVHKKLSNVKHIQDILRSYEARDRNLAERNFTLVNYWSIFQLVFMMIVGAIQVYMLKSLFDDNPHRRWNIRGSLRGILNLSCF